MMEALLGWLCGGGVSPKEADPPTKIDPSLDFPPFLNVLHLDTLDPIFDNLRPHSDDITPLYEGNLVVIDNISLFEP